MGLVATARARCIFISHIKRGSVQTKADKPDSATVLLSLPLLLFSTHTQISTATNNSACGLNNSPDNKTIFLLSGFHFTYINIYIYISIPITFFFLLGDTNVHISCW